LTKYRRQSPDAIVSDRPSAACCELAIRVSMACRMRVLARATSSSVGGSTATAAIVSIMTLRASPSD
jgi:hypothetical protein